MVALNHAQVDNVDPCWLHIQILSDEGNSNRSATKRIMGRAIQRAGQLPAALFIGLFIICQQLTRLPFKALAALPDYTSDQLTLSTQDPTRSAGDTIFHRSQFPDGFIFGTGTSAYQVEGAVTEGGKGVSIWDTWSHTPGKIDNGDTGDVAADQYHRYEEDLDLVAAMNMDSYRFSIAWTRIFPNGTGPGVNIDGIDYYNRVIDGALARGITPMVTLYHWDLPQALQDSYDGWLSPQSVVDFAAYAEVCFEAFGDRVKRWTTFNEPGNFVNGYGGVKTPPGRSMNPGEEPYIAAHNLLLAHAAAVDVYRRLFQAEQGGVIGMTLDCIWGEPLTNSTADFEAAQRYVTFQLGWFLDPIYFGDYPDVMRKNVRDRLPRFSEDQVLQLKGSLDFIGINYYTSRWVTDGPGPLPGQKSDYDLDGCVTVLSVKGGQQIGPRAASTFLYVTPWGLNELLKWTSARYNAPIVVTENGYDNNDSLSLKDSLNDAARIQFYQDYLSFLLQAVREGVNVQGYFAWSLVDNFEWRHGYYLRFGLVYVNYKNNLSRHPKNSYHWFAKFLDRAQPELWKT